MSRPRSLSIAAPAKLNLNLRIVGRRDDGYHLLESVMVPISLADSLVVSVASGEDGAIEFRCNQDELPADDRNLAVRAARVFQRQAGWRPALTIRLEKRVPMGAGLGGGSSDAAAVLVALDRLAGTGVGRGQLATWAVEIGADVPFFVIGRPARVRGIGELIEPFESWASWPLVVVFPGVNLATAEVYRVFDASLTKITGESTIPVSVNGETPLRELLINDLEAAATQIYPPLKALQRRLMDFGALGAAMTGSGSAMFGVWPDRIQAESAAARLQEEGLWAHAVEILSRIPEAVEV